MSEPTSARPPLTEAARAVAAVLEHRGYPRREIVGSVDVDERLLAGDYPWRWIVLARTRDEEWLLYGVRPTFTEDPPGDDEFLVSDVGLLVTDRGSVLSHAEGLLRLLGIATGIAD